MPKVDRLSDLDMYRRMQEMKSIVNSAVKQAQQRSRDLGIPNVYSRNGQIYHENARGEIVRGNPFRSEK